MGPGKVSQLVCVHGAEVLRGIWFLAWEDKRKKTREGTEHTALQEVAEHSNEISSS